MERTSAATARAKADLPSIKSIGRLVVMHLKTFPQPLFVLEAHKPQSQQNFNREDAGNCNGFFKLPTEEEKKYGKTDEGVGGFEQAFVISEEQKHVWVDLFFLPLYLRLKVMQELICQIQFFFSFCCNNALILIALLYGFFYIKFYL